MTAIRNSDLFAAIDLGSNSFHMLVARRLSGSIQIVAKIKRKVRLAAGLDCNLTLSDEAMARGWQCLALFAERLHSLPPSQVRVVATATLRLATNANVFIEQARQILGYPVEIISGEQEAELIYQGAAYTSAGSDHRLILDIGGASTELIIGQGFSIQRAVSLNMGCVRFSEAYFPDGRFTQARFNNAIQAAKSLIEPLTPSYLHCGWQICLGASGTFQAVQEILLFQGQDESITLAKLEQLQAQLLSYPSLQLLAIPGLSDERKPVFAGGLAILMALFQQLNIQQLQLSGGALREGLLYGMMKTSESANVRQLTLFALAEKYHLDKHHAEQCRAVALQLFAHYKQHWEITPSEGEELLGCAALLHEIGLTIGFIDSHKHGAYILSHTPQPGFSKTQQALLATLVGNSRGKVNLAELDALRGFPPAQIQGLVRILRWAVILTSHRTQSVVLPTELETSHQETRWLMPSGWFTQHPLTTADLMDEQQEQARLGWPFSLTDVNCRAC